jgi:hypothetical protein
VLESPAAFVRSSATATARSSGKRGKRNLSGIASRHVRGDMLSLCQYRQLPRKTQICRLKSASERDRPTCTAHLHTFLLSRSKPRRACCCRHVFGLRPISSKCLAAARSHLSSNGPSQLEFSHCCVEAEPDRRGSGAAQLWHRRGAHERAAQQRASCCLLRWTSPGSHPMQTA